MNHETAAENAQHVSATGYARKLARERDIPLAGLHGSGPNGRILASDIPPRGDDAPPAAYGQRGTADLVTRMPLNGTRKTISDNLGVGCAVSCAASTEIDVTALLACRNKLAARVDVLGCRITINDLLAMAVVRMLRKHPMANATFDGETVSAHSSVNLAFAVSTESGHALPVVRGADRMRLSELHDTMDDLAGRARSGMLRRGEQSGGTITMVNAGASPMDSLTPPIYAPQVAVLGFGRAARKPAVCGGEIRIRDRMTVCLAFDTRVIDGSEAGRMMQDMETLLETPELLLA